MGVFVVEEKCHLGPPDNMAFFATSTVSVQSLQPDCSLQKHLVTSEPHFSETMVLKIIKQ